MQKLVVTLNHPCNEKLPVATVAASATGQGEMTVNSSDGTIFPVSIPFFGLGGLESTGYYFPNGTNTVIDIAGDAGCHLC